MSEIKEEEMLAIVFTIKQGNFKEAGEASSKVKNSLVQLGFPSVLIRRVAIATYEAEMNLVIHSYGGKIETKIKPSLVEIVVTDLGPGIADLDKAMKTGFSTAKDHIREMGFGAGMGLPNMRNCASEFSISSKVGQGTVIKMLIS